MSSSSLAHRRSTGAMVRAHSRNEPLSGDEMVTGLFALVRLRFCYDLFAAAAQDRTDEEMIINLRGSFMHRARKAFSAYGDF
jgi:hypothetical protein